MCDHGHDGHGHSCGHEVLDADAAVEGVRYDMVRHVDLDKVAVLNEAAQGSGRNILKEWDERFDRTRHCESDCDEELLINIPFRGTVKLTGFCVIGEEGGQHPARIRLFKDRAGLSLDDASLAADQEILLREDVNGTVDYPLKASKFNSLSHLSIHVDRNFGSDTTKIYHIGLRGEFVENFRQQVVIATYEARAVPKDHKGSIPDAKSSDVW